MTISTADRNRYRGGFHSTRTILNRVPIVPLATAQINQAAFTYPVSQLTVDTITSFGTVKAGHMVFIGTQPGLWDVTVGVVKSFSGSTLKIDAKSQGDPGSPRSIITPLADNQYITIIKFRPAWGLLSSIRNGVFYKNWDVPYTGQGVAPEPIPLMGAWRQAFAPAAGTATISLDCSESYAWRGSIASVLWSLDGGSVVTGTLTSTALTASFAPGFYELECRVTDSYGKQRTGYRYLWVNVDDPANSNAPFNYRYACQITDDKQEVKGREITLDFTGNLGASDELFPGQGFLLTEFPLFNGESLEGDSFVGSFAGYATDGGKSSSYKKRTTTITIKSPLLMAENIPSATQEINEVPNPADWSQVAKVLSNPPGAAYYIAAHHAPYLIDGHDFEFDPELLKLRRQTFQFKSTTIAGQIKTVSDMGLCLIGNRSNGRLRMVRNPFYMSLDDRNALATYWTFAPQDIVGELNKVYMLRLNNSQQYGYAFAFDGAASIPYASLAPGYVRAQADGQGSMTPFIVTTAEGQTRVNAVTGHEFARSNNLPPYSLVLSRNMDFIEPIDADLWYALNVPASYDSEGFGWINERAQATRLTRQWTYDRGVVKSIQVEFEPESYGVPGVTVPVDRGGANNWWLTDWNPGVFDVFSEVMPDLGLNLPVMLACNSYGLLARTFTFSEPEVAWQRLTGFSGTVLSFSLDYNSPYFADSTQALRFYVVTRDGSNLRVYKLVDALATRPVFTELTGSPLAAGTGFTGKAKIKVSRGTADLILVVWRNQTGVMFSRSTAATPSLSSAAHIGATVTDADHDDEPVGMDIYNNIQVAIAPDGTTGTDGKKRYRIYKATGTGSFAALTGNPGANEGAAVGFAMAADWGYATYIDPAPPTPPAALGVVTFDLGGQTGYTVEGVGVISGGRPGDAAYSSFNADGAGGAVGVAVLCTFPNGQYNITDVEFDTKQVITGGVTDSVDKITIKAYSGGKLVGSGNAELRENYGDGWVRYGLRSDQLKLSEPPESIRVSYGYSFTDSAPTTIVYAYIDNIRITGTAIIRETKRTLYRIVLASDTWTDITPTNKQVPLNSYSLASYPADLANLSLAGSAESGKNYLLNTTTAGSAWSVISRTPYKNLARGGDVILGWGVGVIGISADAGLTFYNRLGDWSAAVGSIGEFITLGGVL